MRSLTENKQVAAAKCELGWQESAASGHAKEQAKWSAGTASNPAWLRLGRVEAKQVFCAISPARARVARTKTAAHSRGVTLTYLESELTIMQDNACDNLSLGLVSLLSHAMASCL